jgi:NAD(P)H dehydrogenase (quinone)
MAKVFTVYHSLYGHTKLQAEAVHAGVGSVPGVEAVILNVEEATARMDELDSAAGIIFGCPTYMGSMSAGMKQFLEAAAKKWFTFAWKDKIAGGFTNSSSFSGDKLNTLTGLMINAMQHGMIYVSLGLMPGANEPEGAKSVQGFSPKAHNRVGSFSGAMASSFQVNPGDAPAAGDIETAKMYGKRVAEIAVKMANG